MNRDAAKIFSSLILPEKTVRIKLLGDSITHGVGGTGFAQSGQPITQGFSRNPDGFCWAKLLKDYLESHFDCQVVNNGCTGTTINFILDNFDALVDPEDDIILCTIGTNNRHQFFYQGPKWDRSAHMEGFYQKILALHDKFIQAGKTVIFMANIPASAQNEEDCAPDTENGYWRIMHMNDIDELYKKAWCDLQFPFISLYDLFNAYCAAHDRTVDSLLIDGLHPNDEGYDVMFTLLTQTLEV
jgi:lysophospholipase L1-like esterase